jgi:hypothetical protein
LNIIFLDSLSLVLSDSLLAAILTTCRTYCVVNIVSTTVRAYSECWSYCLVMSTTLECTSL